MRYSLSFFAFLCVFSAQSFAQTTQIGFEDAIKIALENNLNIKQAENTLELRKTEVLSEKLDALPSLSTSSNLSRRNGFQFNNFTLQLGEFTTYFFNANVNFNMTLFAGLQNLYQIRAAENDFISQEETLKRAKEDVIFNTASVFLAVLLDRELLAIQQKNLESAVKQLEQIQAQVEVGAVPQVDLFNQESNVATIEVQVLQRENALKFDEVRLIRQLQIDPTREYEVIAPIIDDASLVFEDKSLGDLLALAYQSRADLKSRELQVNVAQQNLKATKAQYLPRISLSGNYGSDYNDQIRDRINGEILKVTFQEQFFNRNPGSQIGLNMQIPIFQNWNRTTQVQQASVNFENSKLQYENQRLQVLQEVRQAYNDYMNFAKQVESTKKSMLAAERALETEQERYNVGASTLIELTRAYATYTEAASNRAQALYNFVFQEVLLDYFVGKITEEVQLMK